MTTAHPVEYVYRISKKTGSVTAAETSKLHSDRLKVLERDRSVPCRYSLSAEESAKLN